MEAATDPDGPIGSKRTRESTEDVEKKAQMATTLLDLPVEVYRHTLSLLPYSQQLSLRICSRGLKAATGMGIARAGR